VVTALVPTSFTPDGKQLAYFDATRNGQIWTVPLEEQGGRLKAGKPEQFLKTSFNDVYAVFSPDGRWLAYRSNESGKNEVYVRAFPPPSSIPIAPKYYIDMCMYAVVSCVWVTGCDSNSTSKRTNTTSRDTALISQPPP